jgi:protease-4
MTAVYELFVRRVSEGRGLPIEQIQEVAEGRIFAGDAALDGHLVDEWGGMDRAIAVAKDLGHLPEEAPVRLVGQGLGFFDWLESDDESEAWDPDGSKSPWAWAIAALAGRPRGPADLADLGPFLASVRPLFRGEHAIAAIPFALLLH